MRPLYHRWPGHREPVLLVNRFWLGATAIIVVGIASTALLFWFHAWESPRQAERARSSSGRPDVLVYLIDTLRPRELGCYGAVITQTPAFDSFAAEATLFESAYTPSSWTRPAVASLLTGVSPAVHGIETFEDVLAATPPSLVRLPELLQRQGYYTGAIVANPQVDPIFGFAPGFDFFRGLYEERTDLSQPLPADMISTATTVIDEVKRFFEAVPPERPFFLLVLTIDPHSPYAPPAPYDAMYDPRAVDDNPLAPEDLQRIRDRMAAANTSPRQLALYRGEISFADAAFGDLIRWMRKRRLLDRTLVVLTADHGEEFAEHGNKGHGKTLFDEVVRIPLLLRNPRLFAAGQRRSETVDLLDLTATIATLAGASVPDHWVGRDLRRPLPQRPIFSSSRLRAGHHYTAVRLDDYKLIYNLTTDTRELYDLGLDPAERRALDGLHHRAAFESLTAELTRFRDRSASLRDLLLGGRLTLSRDELPEDLRQRLEALGYVDRE